MNNDQILIHELKKIIKYQSLSLAIVSCVLLSFMLQWILSNNVYKKTVESASYKAISELMEKQQSATNVNNQTINFEK